ncbi:MAG: division/cell wall cluster transcriptional repressor MraZ [Verrucomicrobiia bacterium]
MPGLVVKADSMSPFMGEYRHRLEQNRVTLPGRWRQAATTKAFVLVLWPVGVDQHLLALPPGRWAKLLKKTADGELTDEELAATERVLGGSVAWVELDNAGRLALPEHMVSRAGIADEVVLVGRLDKFELWEPQRYAQVLQESRKIASNVLKRLGI